MKIYNTLQLCLFLAGITMSLTLNAQTDKNFIGISIQANSYPQLDMVINYSYSPTNSSLSTKSLFGGEINLHYGRNIMPNTQIRLGLLGGVQPYGLTLYAINFDASAPGRYLTDNLSGYEVTYVGLKIEAEWRLWGTKNYKHSIVIFPGIITAYHIPRDISLEYTYLFNDGTKFTLFEIEEIIINKNNSVSIGGTIGLGYRNRISEKIYFSLGGNIMYSGGTVMETTNVYKLSSLDAVRTGSFSHRFMSAGFNIGVSYRLGHKE